VLQKRIVLLTILFLFPLLVFAKVPVSSHQTIPVYAKTFGPTVTCDDLWQIAFHLSKDNSIIPQQVMMALLNKNSHAFYKKNINGLMRGYWLKIPSVQEIKKIPPVWARREVARQNKVWKQIKASFEKNPTPVQQKLSHVVCPSSHVHYLPKRFFYQKIQDQKPVDTQAVIPTNSTTMESSEQKTVSLSVTPTTPLSVSTTQNVVEMQNTIDQLKTHVTELQQTNAFLSQHVSDLLSQKQLWEQTKAALQSKIQGLEQQLSLFTQRFGQQQETTTNQTQTPAPVVQAVSKNAMLQDYLKSIYDNIAVKNFLAKYPALNNMLQDEDLRLILTVVTGIVILLLLILILKVVIHLLSRGKKKDFDANISLESHVPFDEKEVEEQLKQYEVPSIEEPEPEESAEEEEAQSEEEESEKEEKSSNYKYLAGEDVVTSKLDLAHAYIDMGDFKNARDILTSVVSEGNEDQKQEAEELLKQIENK